MKLKFLIGILFIFVGFEFAKALPASSATRVYGQSGNFTTASIGIPASASNLVAPTAIAVDSIGNVYIADTFNNRVLVYAGGSTTATLVYGQNGSLSANSTNNGGISANSLNFPEDIAIDASGNVYICDSLNNRVLYFPRGSTTATRVYGQPGFTTKDVGSTATGLNLPTGVVVDSSNNVYICDNGNNRVLYYPSGTTTPSRVYGQTVFTTSTAGASATGLNGPFRLALDTSGNLYVSENNNNRVLYFPSGTTTATRVYGQANFTATTTGTTATSLNYPDGIALDYFGNLYVVDKNNNRVLYYPSGTTTATNVYGQANNLTTSTTGTTSSSFDSPQGIAIDSNGNLYVVDTLNQRALLFAATTPIITSSLNSFGSVNGSYSYSIAATLSPVSYAATGLPSGLTINTSTGIISGTPTVSGLYSVQISATTSTSFTGTATLTLAVYQTVMSDNFAIDTSMNTSYWTVGSTVLNFAAVTFQSSSLQTIDRGHIISAQTYNGAIELDGSVLLHVKIPTSGKTESVSIAWKTNGAESGIYDGPAAGLMCTIDQSGTITLQNVADTTGTQSIQATLPAFTLDAQIPFKIVDYGNYVDVYINNASNPTVSLSYTNTNQGGGYLDLFSHEYMNTKRNVVTGPDGYAAFQNFTVKTVNAIPLFTSASTATGIISSLFSFQSTASSTPTSYTATGLPAGLSINTATGLISGTPTAAGVSNAVLTATNAAGSSIQTLTISITSVPVPLVTSSATATATVGSAFSYQITASNAPTSYSATGLPSGLTINTTSGLISGTPTAAGVSNAVLTATNAAGSSIQTLTISITSVPVPLVTSSATATATVGSAFSYQITASNAPTSYSATGLPSGLTINTTSGLISGTPTAAGTFSITVSATNADGSGTKTVTATIKPQAPAISSAANATAMVGTPFSYQIVASNNPASYSATGLPAGLTLGTYTGLISGNPTTNVTSVVALTATNDGGSGTLNLTITVTSGVTAPTITTQPTTTTVTVGSSATLSVIANGTSPTYQWYLNGTAISSATNSTYTIPAAASKDAGFYTVAVTNSAGTVTSSAAILTVTNPGRLINLSVLSLDGPGSQLLTIGFVNGGGGTSGAQNLLIRGGGPSIASFGVSPVLPDPVITLFQGSATVVTNDNWGSTPANATAVTTAGSATGAFPFSSTSSLDSAVVQALPGVAGGYTVQVAGKNADTGKTLAEIYDYTSNYSITSTRLINLSCKQLVPASGKLTAGFVIGGNTSLKVLIRASGPTLTTYGVPGVMPDPRVTVYDSSANVLASNTGWAGSATISAANTATGAFQFTSATSKDSAAVLTLIPGSYTVDATSATGTAGVTLIEVYEVPAN